MKCDICGDGLAACSLQSHLATKHDVHTNVALSLDLLDVDRKPRTYRAIHPSATGLYFCPVLGCEGEAPTKYGLRRHFAYCHTQDYVDIPGEGRYSKCGRCGMQVNPSFTGHRSTGMCETMKNIRDLRRSVSAASKALGMSFSADRVNLENVEVFKHLGRLLAYDDVDTQAAMRNLEKAWRVWARILAVLRAEHASPRVCGIFLQGYGSR